MTRLARFLPFLAWFPPDRATLRADVAAGVTVALVLVPQSMAYAQLAGLPPVYGLYTALLPVAVAALFGSCGQLATGPVAVVSLLTASALAPLAAQGTAQYVAYAITLALLVGAIQLALGAFRLGVLVSFLSHPVVSGFTSAAAIIIALSQLNKLLGVPIGRSGVFFVDIWGVLEQAPDAHLPTVAFGVGAFGAMWLFRRYAPRWPGVLIAVAASIALSAATGFEKSASGPIASIADPVARAMAQDWLDTAARVSALTAERAARSAELRTAQRTAQGASQHSAALGYQVELLSLEIEDLGRENRRRLRLLRALGLAREDAPDGPRFVPAEGAAAGATHWRIRSIDADGVRYAGGGEVVGRIPPGLPSVRLPTIDFGALATLLASGFVIALVGFMEAISIAKAIAARTRQRVDANQELVGQGLANLAGALTQCFPASGSFSRTAVGFAAGARTGLSSVVTAALVMLTLLALTPLLYHLPQAVLAAVIMMAVFSLVNPAAIVHAWRARRHDGIAATATFVATLALAPHLDLGILTGTLLAVGLFLYRTMRPRVAVLGRHPDGRLRDAELHGLPLSEHVVAVRFDGELYFANVPYFEDSLLEVAARFPKAKHVLVAAGGINQVDASGDETIRLLAERLRENGVTLALSGVKKQVRDVLEATGTAAVLGPENLFADEEQALAALAARVDAPDFDRSRFPLAPEAARR